MARKKDVIAEAVKVLTEYAERVLPESPELYEYKFKSTYVQLITVIAEDYSHAERKARSLANIDSYASLDLVSVTRVIS